MELERESDPSSARRELGRRRSSALEVVLYWCERASAVTLSVSDARAGGPPQSRAVARDCSRVVTGTLVRIRCPLAVSSPQVQISNQVVPATVARSGPDDTGKVRGTTALELHFTTTAAPPTLLATRPAVGVAPASMTR
jgi:hypothetical protein